MLLESKARAECAQVSGEDDDGEADEGDDEERGGERVRETRVPEHNGERLEQVERFHQLVHEEHHERREPHMHPVLPEAFALRLHLPPPCAALSDNTSARTNFVCDGHQL